MQHLEDKNSDLSTDGAVGVAREFLVRCSSLCNLCMRSETVNILADSFLQVKMAQPLSEEEKQQQVFAAFIFLSN